MNYKERYFKHHGIDNGDWVACKHCAGTAVDIHHIVFKGKGSIKTFKLEGETYEIDDPINLIPLCRKCHRYAHTGILSKDMLRLLNKTSKKML